MIDVTNPRLLHFTHVDNLTGIMARGLHAPGDTPGTVVECAEPGIKRARGLRAVPIPPGGVVTDYVPFYFAPRSPMLSRIHHGGVAGYGGGQRHLIYLCSRLARVRELGLPWVASDRNAAVATARYTGDPGSLSSHIDWPLMEARYWADTSEDGSRKQRRMAEFLVHHSVPWVAVLGIVVIDDDLRKQVTEIMGRVGSPVPVAVTPSWYF